MARSEARPLETALGTRDRVFRRQPGMTLTEFGRLAGLSPAMRPNGPEELVRLPIRCLSIMCRAGEDA